MKTCNSCGLLKQIDMFWKNKTTGYIGARCIECQRAVARERAKKRTPEQRQRERARASSKNGKAYCTRDVYLNLQQRRSQQKAFDDAQTSLAVQNAYQAFKYWIRYKAHSHVVDAFFLNTPWMNPRLNNTEKYRTRYRSDESYRINERRRRAINKIIKRDGIADLMRAHLRNGTESRTVKRLLGYSIAELKGHLEALFDDGMNWDLFNKGLIHFDHIKPQVAYNTLDYHQWKECWALKNMQPMWAAENLSKSSRFEGRILRRVPPEGPHLRVFRAASVHYI